MHHSVHNDAEIDACFDVDDTVDNDEDKHYSFTPFELLDDDVIAGTISSDKRSKLWAEYVSVMIGNRDYQISRNLKSNLSLVAAANSDVDTSIDNDGNDSGADVYMITHDAFIDNHHGHDFEDWKYGKSESFQTNIKTFVIDSCVYYRLLSNPSKFVSIVDAIEHEND